MADDNQPGAPEDDSSFGMPPADLEPYDDDDDEIEDGDDDYAADWQATDDDMDDVEDDPPG